MSKLTNTYTTIEQSRRLLALGIPKDTADCYYTWIPAIMETASIPQFVFPGCKYTDVASMKTEVYSYEPCWTAGRLIEIMSLITPCPWQDYREPAKHPATLIERVIVSLEGLCKLIGVDFTKIDFDGND